MWGRQGLLDNTLADKGAVGWTSREVEWTSSGAGTFSEGRVRSEWRDDVANDRQVTFVAPSEPGTVTLTASLVDSAECLAQQEDETPEDHEVALQRADRSDGGATCDGTNYRNGTGQPAGRDTGDPVG